MSDQPIVNHSGGLHLTRGRRAPFEKVRSGAFIIVDRGEDDARGMYLACGGIPTSDAASASRPVTAGDGDRTGDGSRRLSPEVVLVIAAASAIIAGAS